MTPACAACAYTAAATGLPARDCTACRRALLHNIAFNPAYRGLTADRLAAVAVALAAIATALLADTRPAVLAAALVAALAIPYALISRQRPDGRHRRRRAPRLMTGRADAAAAAPPIATRRRPQTTRK